jgi:hypothetical protein
MIRIGTILYGFCGGHFYRDTYEDKRVEGVGADWIVVRTKTKGVDFALGEGIVEKLERYTFRPADQIE